MKVVPHRPHKLVAGGKSHYGKMATGGIFLTQSNQRYQRRRPERTLWYRIVQTHLETWLELASGENGEAPPPMSNGLFAAISNAASSLTASPEPTATSASTIS